MVRSMGDGKHFYERPGFWPRLIGGVFLFTFLVAFSSEIRLVYRILVAFFQVLFYGQASPLSQDTPRALILLMVNLVVYLGVYFLTLKWVSFFVLPARDPRERQQVFDRLMGYIFKLHGPAVFIKTGELITRKEEEGRNELARGWFASLVFVDLASAVVLESRSRPPAIGL